MLRLLDFQGFLSCGENVKASWFGARLCQKAFRVLVNDIVAIHVLSAYIHPFLYIVSDIVVERSVESTVILLS